MDVRSFEYLLFPHMAVGERDLRHLAILLPHLSLLQVVRPPAIPEWAQQSFSSWPTIEDQALLAQIQVALKGLQEFADLHQENTIHASLSQQWMARQLQESRFRIQSELRGKKPAQPDAAQPALLEAGIFLEIARNLDEKEMELNAGIAGVRGLEEEFLRIVGITEDDDLAETAQVTSPALAPERTHLSFMLPKRIAFWLQLIATQLPERPPVLVALIPEVLEEIQEILSADPVRQGKSAVMDYLCLGSLPALEQLPQQDFISLLEELQASGILNAYWQDLEAVISAPQDSALGEPLRASADNLQRFLQDFCRKVKAPEAKREVTLKLPFMQDATPAGLLKNLDRGGAQNIDLRALNPRALLLYSQK